LFDISLRLRRKPPNYPST